MTDSNDENEQTEKDEKGSELEKQLAYKLDFCYKEFTSEQKESARSFAQEYKDFLGSFRTERERVAFAEQLAKEKGFQQVEIGQDIQPLQPGDKVYYVNRGKNIALFIIGEISMLETMHFVGAHADYPRLDLKIRPLYEKDGFALFKTHYYGGLKKYQYATVPLALTGVVVKKDGTKIKIDIGRDADDPVFMVPDLLIHLAKNVQGDRKAFDVLKAEEMNALAGAIPFDDEKAKEKFKLNVLNILHERYDIIEEDFHSAELSLVPTIVPRYVGIDKSMIGGAGQDDGSCSYLTLRSITDLAIGTPPCTIGAGIFDKEETGSNGPTGAQSAWFRQVFTDLVARTGIEPTLMNTNVAMRNMKMISADVTASLDPSFNAVHDLQTAAIAGKGVVVEKYGGSGGKYGTNDATAEYMGYIRGLFADAKVPVQYGTLGQVDAGGGGTIAMFFSQAFNCDVVDCGVPVLDMHSPFEVVHIYDLYAGYIAYTAFFSAK